MKSFVLEMGNKVSNEKKLGERGIAKMKIKSVQKKEAFKK